MHPSHTKLIPVGCKSYLYICCLYLWEPVIDISREEVAHIHWWRSFAPSLLQIIPMMFQIFLSHFLFCGSTHLLVHETAPCPICTQGQILKFSLLIYWWDPENLHSWIWPFLTSLPSCLWSLSMLVSLRRRRSMPNAEKSNTKAMKTRIGILIVVSLNGTQCLFIEQPQSHINSNSGRNV